ncbi:MAG: flavohemoprotein [Gemmatimonadaceae bacterium]|nr:flavohemoprotein [Gloeobacterales cyanobacterium ES-bin-141]
MSLDIERLEQSFARIRPQATAFSARFYDVLFTDYPQVRPLFVNSDMVEQQQKLFASLELVVANLRDPDTVGRTLAGLGERHRRYGVVSEHYPMVGDALLKTLERQLATEWTAEVQSAWTVAFSTISQVMQDAERPLGPPE